MMYILGFLLLLVIIYIYFYNQLNSERQSVIQSWSDIDVQLNRRHDLIPNLVRVVKAYASYEKTLLEELVDLRTKALSIPAQDISSKAVVEQQVSSVITNVLAVVEKYPDLKADSGFLKLQDELTRTEDEIASSRRIYNENVAEYLTHLQSFPSGIIASLQNFPRFSYFQNNSAANGQESQP